MRKQSILQLCIEVDPDFYFERDHPIQYVFGGRRVFRQQKIGYDKPTPPVENGVLQQNEGGITANGVPIAFGDVIGADTND